MMMASGLEIAPLLKNAANPTYAYVCAFVDELQRAGIHNVVICPGSRSTPLALACAAQPGLRAWMHVDERSAAFFALGMAKHAGQPVALLCTSGTAAANFFPALVEAQLTHVPLVVLTSDRPHELRENGAPQSIDQAHLYGSHVKWFVDVALPEATNAALRYIRTTANRATALAAAIPAGPVHLNFPLREPLTPAPIADQPLLPVEQRDTIAWLGRPNNEPYVTVRDTGRRAPDSATISHLVDLTSKARHGLIICGPQDDTALLEPLVQVAQLLGYPMLADPLSQMRSTGAYYQSHVLTSYDAFLRIDTFVEKMQPELVLRFGAMPTAKPVLTYLKRYPSCPLIVIDGNEDWQEPTQLATELLHVDPVALCEALIASSVGTASAHPRMDAISDEGRAEAVPTGDEWLLTWQQADEHTRQALQTTMQDFTAPFEGRVFTELTQILPRGTTLYTGNSMPVRDLDTFFWGSKHALRIMGNRGANGIDGIVSSALGASAVSAGPNVLVIGDLSFFHDMNGLLAAKLHKLDLTIVVINNDGGGIFSFLPQADYPEHFEQLFGTPIGLDFSHAAQMYGGHYQRVVAWKQFRAAVQHGMHDGGLHIIEVTTERESNVRMHRQLWQSVGSALQQIIREENPVQGSTL
ncbi:MAG: 2-succinyl-5-enolpyruvyl-6-hydroxy-3-cyclohexene-1-carboxylic-acid synthase [Ktedonobacteraceae bacterium]